MKPIYKSKKFQTAILTVLGVVAAHYTGNDALVDNLTALGAMLIGGFAAADHGKEAAHVKKAAK